jgi:hypothetical protein
VGDGVGNDPIYPATGVRARPAPRNAPWFADKLKSLIISMGYKFAFNKVNPLISLDFQLLSTKMSSYRGLKWGRGSASQRLRTKQGMGVVAIPIRRHQLALLIASIAS